MKDRAQFSPDEVLETARQANLRIHVERAFGRMKNFHFLSKKVKINQMDLIGSVFHVVAMLTNFMAPLVGNEDKGTGDGAATAAVDSFPEPMATPAVARAPGGIPVESESPESESPRSPPTPRSRAVLERIAEQIVRQLGLEVGTTSG